MSTPRKVTVGHPHSQTSGDGVGTAWPYASVSVTGGTVYMDEGRTRAYVFPYKVPADGWFRFFAPAGTYTVTYTHPVTAATAVEIITVA